MFKLAHACCFTLINTVPILLHSVLLKIVKMGLRRLSVLKHRHWSLYQYQLLESLATQIHFRSAYSFGKSCLSRISVVDERICNAFVGGEV